MADFLETQQVPDRRLGRRPPSNKPAIMFAQIAATAVLPHPSTVDNLDDVTDFGLYGNDQYGDCGPVSVANSIKLLTKIGTGEEVSVTQADVFDLYRRSGNPNFDPETDTDDNGVDMQTMLEALLKDGIGGRKPLAFAKVDVTNLDEVRAAIAYFGCVLFGIDLQLGQQDDSDPGGVWDYEPSREWGGHAIVAGKYTSRTEPGVPDFSAITWAFTIGMTDAFCAHQLEEAWVVIWPEHLTHPDFLAGVDINALAAAYTALTDRPFPAVVPPEPVPVPPAPTPVPPGAAPFPGASVEVAARIARAAARSHLDIPAWMNRHFDRYFRLTDAGDWQDAAFNFFLDGRDE